MLRRLSIAQRMILNLGLLIGLAALITVAFTFALDETRTEAGNKAAQVLDDEVQHKLQVATHAMASGMGAVLARTPAADWPAAVSELVKDLRYGEGDSGYFFVYRGTTVVMNPVRPEAVGQSMADSQDVNGVYFIRDLAKAAGAGGGFVRYVFDKPGGGATPKLSYAEPVPGTDLWIGTGVYIDNLAATQAAVAEQLDVITHQAVQRYVLPLALLALFGVLPLAFATSKSIVRPLRVARDAMQEIARGDGDLTRRLDDEGSDEVAELAAAFNEFVRSLQGIIRGLGESSSVLSSSASTLSESTQRMSGSATQIRTRSSTTHEVMQALKGRVGVIAGQSKQASGEVENVASTTHELSSSAARVLEGSETISRQIDDLAAAMEELSTASREVAHRSAETAQAGQASKTRVEAVVNQMGRLDDAAQAIGKVVDLINGVAEQTNLLALNASIEAAGAGAAGRGFAVVANEVKVLARRTADATGEIRRQVEDMQAIARQTLDMAKEVGVYSSEVGRLTEAIAAASEEQTSTLDELAKSVNEGAESVRVIRAGIAEISGGVDLLATSSGHLAKGSQQMAGAADQMAGHTDHAFTDLSALLAETDKTVVEIDGVGQVVSLLQGRATSLQDVVGRFRV